MIVTYFIPLKSARNTDMSSMKKYITNLLEEVLLANELARALEQPAPCYQ